MTDDFVTIDWTSDSAIRLIDQTRLPLDEVYVECRTVEEVATLLSAVATTMATAFVIAESLTSAGN